MASAEQELEKAKSLLRRCDPAGLLEACDRFAALSGAPGVGARALAGWAEARTHLARQRMMRGEPWEEEAKGALAQAEQAAGAAPDSADCQRALAVALTPFPEQSERRRSASVRAVELAADDALNWYQRWKAFGSRLDDGAIRRALELDASLFAAIHDLGVALTECGRHEQAIVLLTKALALNANSAQARYNLAVVLERAGRSEESRFVLDEAAQLHPGDALIPPPPPPSRRDYVR